VIVCIINFSFFSQISSIIFPLYTDLVLLKITHCKMQITMTKMIDYGATPSRNINLIMRKHEEAFQQFQSCPLNFKYLFSRYRLYRAVKGNQVEIFVIYRAFYAF
ncbi:hypothetical protein, partial [Bacillus thuringiensis]|uniref:hypothetical protein n=2 Tax=Bacillus thuringiensis TaxID=1428 RepID=UPI002FFDF091